MNGNRNSTNIERRSACSSRDKINHMIQLPEGYSLHSAQSIDELQVRTFHEIARLRQEVFVVEQDCVYLDLDGRDTEAATRQYWIETSSGEVAATLRVLSEHAREPGLHAIGRVATALDHRGRSLAAALMAQVLEDVGAGPLVLEAQSHLTGWYARFGFAACGSEYLEDGIPHTPMRRD